MKALLIKRDQRKGNGQTMKKIALFVVIVFAAVIVLVRVVAALVFVPPILMYHSLDEYAETSKLSVSPESFAKQMEYLFKHKYNVISLGEMVEMIKSGTRVPHKTVAITFDDGYRNNYLIGYPILRHYNFPATLFVITDFVGLDGYVTWEDLSQMSGGVITIGSHTKSTPALKKIRGERLEDEVSGSKKLLEQKLGVAIDYMSYPLGSFDDVVKNEVKKAGYLAAVATNPGMSKRADDVYALKRLRISRTSNNLLVFWLEISGYYTWIKEIRDED